MPFPSAVQGFNLALMDQPPPQARPSVVPEGDPSCPRHDPVYKRLFSHPCVVADQLRLLLIEFRSTVDSRMPERMLEYAAMLRGGLARVHLAVAATGPAQPLHRCGQPPKVQNFSLKAHNSQN